MRACVRANACVCVGACATKVLAFLKGLWLCFTRLFASFLVEDTHVREATRRMQPQRATLLDAMEVEVRARAHALDAAAPVAASA